MDITLSKSRLYLIFALITAVIFNWFFLFYRPGLSVIVFVLIEVGLYELVRFMHNKKLIINKFHLLLIPIFFYSLSYAIRADGFVLFLNSVALFTLLPLYTFLTSNPTAISKVTESEVLSTILRILTTAKGIFSADKTNDADKSESRKVRFKGEWIGKVALGLFVTVPVLFVVVLLLASGDAVFAKLISDIIEALIPDISFEAVFKFILSLIIAVVVWSQLKGYIKLGDKYKRFSFPLLDHQSADAIVPTMLTGALNLVYLLFLVIQFDYLLGGKAFAAKHNIDIFDYAIKGFWEMIAVILINYAVIYLIQSKFSFKTVTAKIVLAGSSAFMIFASFVMLVSSHIKLSAYESEFGYTRDRLIPHSFLIFVLSILILVTINLFLSNRYRKKVLILGTFILVNVFLMGFSMFSMDRFIVRHNLDRYYEREIKSDHDLDMRYLTSYLGLEGAVMLADELDNPKLDDYYSYLEYKSDGGRWSTSIKYQFEKNISYEIDPAIESLEEGGWRSWNIPAWSAKKLVESDDIYFSKN